MFKFIFKEIKANLKVFLLSFFILLFLFSSNLNLLSVSVSVRDNIYDSLSGLYYSNSQAKIGDLIDIDLPKDSYAITYSNIDFLTNEKNDFPKINNKPLSEINSNNEDDNIVGNLFYYNQDGFYKFAKVDKYTSNNVIYFSNNLLQKLSLNVGDKITFDTSKEKLDLVIGTPFKKIRFDVDYFISIESIKDIDEYLKYQFYSTYFSLVNLRYYSKAIDILSKKYNIEKEKLRSQYYEDYISLANVVIIVLVSIFIFILIIILVISYKLTKIIINSRKEMILTLSVLGVENKKIHQIYYLTFMSFYTLIFLFSIGVDFILNIFINNAFISSFNFSYVFHHLIVIILAYFLLVLLISFFVPFFMLKKIKTSSIYSQMKKKKKR